VELQVAVEEQADARPAAGDDHALVGAGLAQQDGLAVEAVLGPGGQALGAGQAGQQGHDHRGAGQRMGPPVAQAAAEQPQRPDRHARVEQAEEEAGADQPQVRHQQQREGQRHHQRAQVVEGEHLRDQVLQAVAGLEVALEDAHDQRDLQPHQHAHQDHQRVEQHQEGRLRRHRQAGVGGEQGRRQRAAHHAHQQLDAQELRHQLPVDEAREPGAHPMAAR
jgi:hypothetical protein